MTESVREPLRSPTAPMRPYLQVRHDEVVAERTDGADEDVHFSSTVALAALTDLTRPGDRVLDPFVGFGTTARAAVALGRSAVGVELLPERCAVARLLAPQAEIIEGDARGLRTLVRGPFDLVLTSPPYRTVHDHPDDPLTAYTRTGGDYASYLEETTEVLRHCLDLLSPRGHLALNVANIAAESGFTPLAWDLGAALASLGEVLQDVPICWDRPLHDLAGDYLIIARRRP